MIPLAVMKVFVDLRLVLQISSSKTNSAASRLNVRYVEKRIHQRVLERNAEYMSKTSQGRAAKIQLR